MNFSSKFALLLVTCALCIMQSPLMAWQTVNGILINNNADSVYKPQIVTDGSDGAIITWVDLPNSTTSNIYAQRVNSTGNTLWTSNGVYISGVGSPVAPAITSDGFGGAVIAWEDNRNGPGYPFAQRVNSTGSTLWTFNGVALCTTGGGGAQLISDGTGGAIIVYSDFRNSGYDNLYAQRVSSTGSTLWTLNDVAISTGNFVSLIPSLISDGLGGAIITWCDNRSGSLNIYAQRIDSTGSTLWTNNGVAICTAAISQQLPVITSDGAGGAIITWTDYRNDPNGEIGDIYAQRVNSNGSTLWSLNGVAICTAINDQNSPTLVSDGAGGAIITWQDFRDSTISNLDIYAQRVDSTGSTLWTLNGVALCTALYNQYYPKIISDGSNGAIITWFDYRNGGTSDIYAQRINSIGSTLWTGNGVPICTATNSQSYPVIVSDGSGGGIITWLDDRNGANYAIYAQQIDSLGLIYQLPTFVPKRIWELFLE